MPENFIIRHVGPTDYDKWLPLWEGYNTFYGRWGTTALDPEITRTNLDPFSQS